MSNMEPIGERSTAPSYNPTQSEPTTSRPNGLFTLSNSRNTMEEYKKTSCYKDWLRLGLILGPDSSGNVGNKSGHHLIRVTKINHNYGFVSSYPAMILVPRILSDENLRRYGRFHRLSRVPVITWKHPKTTVFYCVDRAFMAEVLLA